MVTPPSLPSTAIPDRNAPQRAKFHVDDDGNGIHIAPWTVRKVEKPIPNASDEERLTEQLRMKLPAMVFHQTHLHLSYESPQPEPTPASASTSTTAADAQSSPAKFQLVFDTVDALSLVGEADPNIEVKAAAKWRTKKQRSDVQITQIKHATDWTYTTKYTGTISTTSPTHEIRTSEQMKGDTNTTPIDYNLLRDTTLPILFSTQVHLFEDELDDNGTTSYKVRIRVMPTFLFILARFFLRVDGVLIRVFDTRYFHRFDCPYIVRETVHREGSIVTALSHLPVSTLRDPDLVAPHVPITFSKLDNIYI